MTESILFRFNKLNKLNQLFFLLILFNVAVWSIDFDQALSSRLHKKSFISANNSVLCESLEFTSGLPQETKNVISLGTTALALTSLSRENKKPTKYVLAKLILLNPAKLKVTSSYLILRLNSNLYLNLDIRGPPQIFI